MDCPSEERMIRMALEDADAIENLSFNFSDRTLTIEHKSDPQALLRLIAPLNYGAKLVSTESITNVSKINQPENDEQEFRVLKILFVLNGAMFLIEIVFGVIARSTGLIADSLDMLADASVYGLSMYAVGKARQAKKHAARLSGYLQVILACGALFEVGRRFLLGGEPRGDMMIGIALLALVVNVACMVMLAKHREGEVHMKASWIFSTNDVIANLGVIAAGFLVSWTESQYPDLIIGMIIGLVVLSGAARILKLA